MLEKLHYLFQQALPGEAAHLEFLPLRGSSKAAIASGAPYRSSAVAIILFENRRGTLSTIITQRQEYNGTHSGQISFPGGKYEPTDKNLLQTAIRECNEEIGIDIREDVLLGQLSQVYIPVSQFLIEPFVFFSKKASFDYHLSEREVATIHEIDLEELFAPQSVIKKDVTYPNGLILKDVPHFQQNRIEIWGATALMLNELKRLLQMYE
jgi:8-oxo-dGTP pyrophosphatase MutT (NUDIX family)